MTPSTNNDSITSREGSLSLNGSRRLTAPTSSSLRDANRGNSLSPSPCCPNNSNTPLTPMTQRKREPSIQCPLIQQQINGQARLTNRRKAMRMLIVVIFEFFLCWSPVYILQTWKSVDYQSALDWVTPATKTFLSLMSYSSACFHPITYCFMNKTFRDGFLRIFHCKKEVPRRDLRAERRNRESIQGRTKRTLSARVKKLSVLFEKDRADSITIRAESASALNQFEITEIGGCTTHCTKDSSD